MKTIRTLVVSAAAAALLTGCVTSNELAGVEWVGKSGAKLPYSVLRDDIVDVKTKEPFEIRNGGYGSDMVAHPSEKNQFYALTDRGPNATFKGELGKGKKFPTPDYTPRIGLFELRADGSIELVKEILLKRPDGTLITGLPNSSALGGTGETPYDAEGKVITVDMSKPYEAKNNPINLDDFGLDGEGLVALSDGTFWVSDEYGPHMVHFNKNGVEIERINAFKNDSRVKYHLPTEYANRRANRGMEGLAVTLDEKTLVGVMQSTMFHPDKSVKNLDITRIVTVDPKTGKVGQFLYKQNKAQNSNSGLVAVGKNKFYIIERDGAFLNGGPKKANPDAQKHVYEIDLTTGTNLEMIKPSDALKQDEELGLTIEGKTLEQVVLEGSWDALAKYGIKPVEKKLVVDMVEAVEYPHDKMEGLWVINEKTLGVINDDDFATWATKGALHAKTLGNSEVDSNTLYIVNIGE